MDVFLFLANGFEKIEAVVTIDVLRRGGVTLTTVSINDSLFVKGAHDITLKADAIFNELDFSDPKLLILPGGMPGTTNLENHLIKFFLFYEMIIFPIRFIRIRISSGIWNHQFK